jgi:hypothetical protein
MSGPTARAVSWRFRVGPSRPRVAASLQATALAALLCLVGAAVAAGQGLYAAAILVALAGAVIVTERPLAGALILVTAVPALSGLNRGLPVPGFRLSELLIVGIGVIALATARSAGWRRFDSIALLYVAGTLILGSTDLVLRGAAFSSDNVAKLIGPLEFFLLYRVVAATATTAVTRARLLKWMFLASVPVACLALLQFGGAPGTRALASAIAGETDSLEPFHHYYRATALFAQGHLLGSFMMLVVLVGVAMLFDSRPLPLGHHLLIVVLILDGLAMVATATITPILGVVAGSFVLAYWYRRVGRAAIVGALAALVLAFAFGSTVSTRYDEQFGQSGISGGTPSTLAFRWDVWTQQYLPTVKTHLTTGYGPDLPSGAVWKATESFYITLLLRGGIPLLLIFGWLMWTVARSASRVNDDRRPVARTMVVLAAILAILHTQNNYFIDSGFPQLWWALAGLVLAATASTQLDEGSRLGQRLSGATPSPRTSARWRRPHPRGAVT